MRNRHIYRVGAALCGLLLVGPAHAQDQEKLRSTAAPTPETAQDQKKRLRSTLPP